MKAETIDAIRSLVTPIRDDIELAERNHIFPDFERLEERQGRVQRQMDYLDVDDDATVLEEEDNRLSNLMGEFDEVTQVLRDIDTLLTCLETMHLTEEDGE